LKLIYISNTRIPSEKANTYQSMVMCEAFSKHYHHVEFWYPQMRNTPSMEKINNPFLFYNVNEVFSLKKIPCIDSTFLFKYFNTIWFLLRTFSFGISYLAKLKNIDPFTSIFTRDSHGLLFLNLAKKLGIIKQKVYFEAHIYSKTITKNSKYIDGIIVINNYLKTLYEKDGVTNILVAHDGVNVSEYAHIMKYQKNTIANIVYTGNLFEWKGVYTLVDSLKYLNNVKCTIIGGSDDTLPQFKKYIEEKKIKNIELTGFVKKSETIKYIENADVLILPNSAKDKMSYYTSPLKLFEYMASKRPIVASSLPSIKEILKDGINATLYEPDNPKDLAKKIRFVLENDCSHMINQAYNDVQKYTWVQRVKNIVNWTQDEK